VTRYVTKAEQKWDQARVRGVNMPSCTLWDGGHDVVTRLFRLPKGCQLPRHKHAVWVQIFVVSGKMHVDLGERTLEAGDFYFVEPGDTHIETALEDTELFIVRYANDPQGARILPPDAAT